MDEGEHDKAMALDAVAKGQVSAGDLKGAAESYGSNLHIWRKLARHPSLSNDQLLLREKISRVNAG